MIEEYFSKNCAVDCFKINEEFRLEILIPMAEIYTSSVMNLWNNVNTNVVNDYTLLYDCYCENSSTKRAGKEYAYSNFSNNIYEFDERKRFSKSYVVILKNKFKKIIGGAWLERTERTKQGIEQKMHIFIEEIHEKKGFGKEIEKALRNYCLENDTKILSCNWDQDNDNPKKFFESIGYEVNSNYARKIIK